MKNVGRRCLDPRSDYDSLQPTMRIAGLDPVILSRRDGRQNKGSVVPKPAAGWLFERTYGWFN